MVQQVSRTGVRGKKGLFAECQLVVRHCAEHFHLSFPSLNPPRLPFKAGGNLFTLERRLVSLSSFVQVKAEPVDIGGAK